MALIIKETIKKVILFIIPVIGFLLLWEITAILNILNPILFSKPTRVFETMVKMKTVIPPGGGSPRVITLLMIGREKVGPVQQVLPEEVCLILQGSAVPVKIIGNTRVVLFFGFPLLVTRGIHQ